MATVFLALLIGVAPARAQEGLFTAAQAERGERVFMRVCARCHGRDLMATDRDAANLTGPEFDVGWIGKTIAERFRTIKVNMPPNDPGNQTDQVYLDIIGFILSFNGYKPGSRELLVGADLNALRIGPKGQ
jgi:mono/diheme cytochrome c family protein